MSSDSGHDDARYLTGSPARVAVLRSLREEPRRPAVLTDAIDATRTTVQRILAGFREREWVVKRDAEYRVTATGKRVHDAYETLLAEIDRADRYGGFAADLERAGAGLPVSALDHGEITAATERDPLAALDRIVTLIRRANGETIRAVSPIVTTQYNEAAASALDGGASVELVIDRAVLRASVDEFQQATDRALSDDNASVYVAPNPIEYGLFRYADIACVIAYGDANNPRYVFESTDPSVTEWVDDRFEAFVANATPLSAAMDTP